MAQLKKEGFKQIGQTGSHVKLSGPNGQGRVTIPVHGDKDMPKGTMRSIEKQIEDARSKQRPKGEEGMKSAKSALKGQGNENPKRSTRTTQPAAKNKRKGR